jgi:hypothetical protein
VELLPLASGANRNWRPAAHRRRADEVRRVRKNIATILGTEQGENMETPHPLPSGGPVSGAGAKRADMKFEVVVIPVADANRSKEFYTKLGWRLDADFPFDNGFRVVQFTPPGSGCSVQFGTKMTAAAPGSAQACT